MRAIPLGLAFVSMSFLLSGVEAKADVLWFHADLAGTNEKAANQTKASGRATARLDTVTKALTYDVTFSGLSGPAERVHYHGPVQPGEKAPEQVVKREDHPTSPTTGTITLNDRQAADLRGGRWYVNVHTAMYPNGEIRGPLVPGE